MKAGYRGFLVAAVAVLLVSLVYPSGVFSQDLSQQIANYEQLAAEFEKNGDANQAAYYFDKAANQAWQARDLNSAIANFDRALANIKQVGNVNGAKTIYTNLGLIYCEKGNHNEAYNNFLAALAAARSLGRKDDIANALVNISTEQIEMSDFTGAQKSLDEAQRLAQEVDNARALKNIYFNFNKVFEQLGSKDKADEYFRLYMMLNKKLQDDEFKARKMIAQAKVDSAGRIINQISYEKESTARKLMETSHELQQTTNILKETERISTEQRMQIDLLNTQMKLREAEIRNQHLLQRIYIGLIIILLMFAAILFWANNQKQKANKLLSEKNAEIFAQKEEISRQADELRELNALKDRLFSIIAHDLRSPLFSLITMLNIAKEGHFTEESFKEIISELSSNVSHTTALLENLLTWAKNQMQGTKVKPERFFLNEVVTPRLQQLNEVALQKNIVITNHVDESTSVYADRDMLDLIIRNLISNAIKFCNAGDKIQIWSSVENSHVKVCVEDTGVGIDAHSLKKLFGSQVSSTPGTRNEKGTGLGLILCREFVEMNNGKIWAESTPGKGSQFFFTLPISGEQASH